MKTSIRFVPIEKWPGKASAWRPTSKFKASYSATLSLLDDELQHVSAKGVVVQAFLRADQIRNDGWPYSNARPSSPGVIVSFTNGRGAFSFPCEKYSKFEDNLRAISLSLQALRAVDRYGVTQRAEQYQGWKRLPEPDAAPFPTVEDAARFLSVKAYQDDRQSTYVALLRDIEARRRAYRSAAALLHPDSPSGSHEEFVLLGKAMKILEVGRV